MAQLQIKKHPKFKDYGADIDGNIYSFKLGTIRQMKSCHHKRGYHQIKVSIPKVECKMYLVHRFAYECNTQQMIPNGLQINHIDNCKTNNHMDNLELVTDYENKQKGKELGVLYGSANPSHPFYSTSI
jgi:hypothetical protein